MTTFKELVLVKVTKALAWLFLGVALPGAVTAADGPKLYVFDCGSISFTDMSAFNLTNEETAVREMFVPCYLIEHTKGRLLWDAGLAIALAGKPPTELEGGVTMRYDTSLVTQLSSLDLTPADIDLVAFSHMHFDHVGAANLFTEAELLIQDTEYAAAFVNKNVQLFEPDLYLGLANNERRLLTGDHDVFGDGSVVIVSAPGHTPGHQVLFLRLAETGPLVLSGDLYHTRESRTLRRAPVFNVDAEQTFASMDKVEALIAKEGATLWIEHDRALADTLRKAPGFYE